MFSQVADRIVSLAPSLTNMIYLLQAQEKLIGCTNYCLEGVRDKVPVVANAIDVNVEKVLLLKPDLVLVTALTKPATVDAIKKLGIKVAMFPSAHSYKGICDQFIELGKYTGKQRLAMEIVKEQEARLARLKKQIPAGPKPKVFFEIGAKPLFTAIPNTFMNDFITYAGGINIATKVNTGSITRENVIIKNPDVIVIVTMGVIADEEKKTWEKYKSLSATQNNRIFSVDPYKSCGPNPVTFMDILEELINKMYK